MLEIHDDSNLHLDFYTREFVSLEGKKNTYIFASILLRSSLKAAVYTYTQAHTPIKLTAIKLAYLHDTILCNVVRRRIRPVESRA